MTNVANKKHEIAKEIRALLMSSPAALTMEEVRRDFHQFMDKPIPFRELGYSTLEDMLRDMTDVLSITFKRGIMCLEAIPDDTTRHIAKLVSKQKIPNKKKYATMRKGPPPRMQRKQVPPSLPYYIRKNISELFKSYGNGLPLTHFDTAYSKRFGSMFSFSRLGFVSMKELIYSVPDLVILKEYQGGEWRVLPAHCHAPDRNWRENDERSRGENWRDNDEISRGENWRVNDERSRGENWRGNGKNQDELGCISNSNRFTQPYAVEQSRLETVNQKPGGRGKGRGLKRSAGAGGDNQTSIGRTSESIYNSSKPDIDPECVEHDDRDESQVLQTELINMLADRPEGIWASQLPFLYKIKYNRQLNFKDQGYMSVIELCNSFPDDIRIERPSQEGDWMLFDARIPRKSPLKPEKEEERKRHTSQKGADLELKEKIRQVVMCRKDGIPLGDFLSFYQKLTGDCLPVDELGFKSVDRFLLSLTDTLLQFKYKGDGMIMVLPLDTTTPQRTDKLKYIPEPEKVVKNTVPDDAILPGACYRFLELPPLGEYFESCVSNIESPGLFWFQIRSKQTTIALDKLMNQLAYFYNSAEGNRYKIPNELMVIGLVVVAIFPEDSNWHRCIITKLETGPMVQVYFVDYGNTCGVHRNNIRLLRSKFLKLANQAIQGRLANIQPNEGQKWSSNARYKLLSMCINLPLVALPTAEKDRVMSLVLIDTSQETDVCYNDTLVHEGYAIFKPDDHTTNLTGSTDAPEVPDYSHVYGITGSQTAYPDTTSVTATSSQDTDILENKRRFVKEVQLTPEYKIHVINIDGVARVLTEEISAFLFEMDVLTGMLQHKRKHFNKIELSFEEQPQVFLELQQLKVIPTNRRCISLYELNSVPMILEVFDHTSGELVNSINEAIEHFYPEELYWKGEVEEGETESEEAVDTWMDKERIELTIDTLRYKRKRILQSLMDVTVSQSEEVVNELNNIEQQITQLKAAYEKAPNPKPVERTEQFKDAEIENQNKNPGNKKSTSKCVTKPLVTATVSPTKMTNVVTPMQKVTQPTLTEPSVSSQSNPSVQNPLNPLNMTPKQMLFQQMLMTQMNQQAVLNPLMSQFMLGQMGDFPIVPGAGRGDQPLSGLNSFPTMQMGNFPLMLGQGPDGQPLSGLNSVPTMQMGNFAPAPGNMIPPMGFPNIGNLPPMLNPSTGQLGDIGNQGDISEMPLLPGLLPLLQTLSLGRGSGNKNSNSDSQ